MTSMIELAPAMDRLTDRNLMHRGEDVNMEVVSHEGLVGLQKPGGGRSQGRKDSSFFLPLCVGLSLTLRLMQIAKMSRGISFSVLEVHKTRGWSQAGGGNDCRVFED